MSQISAAKATPAPQTLPQIDAPEESLSETLQRSSVFAPQRQDEAEDDLYGPPSPTLRKEKAGDEGTGGAGEERKHTDVRYGEHDVLPQQETTREATTGQGDVGSGGRAAGPRKGTAGAMAKQQTEHGEHTAPQAAVPGAANPTNSARRSTRRRTENVSPTVAAGQSAPSGDQRARVVAELREHYIPQRSAREPRHPRRYPVSLNSESDTDSIEPNEQDAEPQQPARRRWGRGTRSERPPPDADLPDYSRPPLRRFTRGLLLGLLLAQLTLAWGVWVVRLVFVPLLKLPTLKGPGPSSVVISGTVYYGPEQPYDSYAYNSALGVLITMTLLELALNGFGVWLAHRIRRRNVTQSYLIVHQCLMILYWGVILGLAISRITSWFTPVDTVGSVILVVMALSLLVTVIVVRTRGVKREAAAAAQLQNIAVQQMATRDRGGQGAWQPSRYG